MNVVLILLEDLADDLEGILAPVALLEHLNQIRHRPLVALLEPTGLLDNLLGLPEFVPAQVDLGGIVELDDSLLVEPLLPEQFGQGELVGDIVPFQLDQLVVEEDELLDPLLAPQLLFRLEVLPPGLHGEALGDQ